MNDFLTKDKSHLRLFQDNIVIDKRLPKWRRAEAGMKKTGSSEYNSAYVTNVENPTQTFLINTTPGMDHTVGTPDIMVGNADNFVPDAGTRNVDIIIIKNVNNTNTIPVSSKFPTQFANIDTKNVPRFVCLNIKQN